MAVPTANRGTDQLTGGEPTPTADEADRRLRLAHDALARGEAIFHAYTFVESGATTSARVFGTGEGAVIGYFRSGA